MKFLKKVEASNDELLWEGPYFNVYKKDGWYIYTDGGNGGVCVLGYRRIGKDAWECLLRYEHTPCHAAGLIATSLTGMRANFDVFRQREAY